jgi:hypothetical protein
MSELEYLYRIPSAAELPEDLILCHNRVRTTRRIGSRGFRIWLQTPDPRFGVCECGWAPEAGPHYAVANP